MANAVENPIINSPFDTPSSHWDFSGLTPQKRDGRRPAGYYGTLRTEKAEGPVAQHEFLPINLVNQIRPRVDEWRTKKWPGVTNVTRDLLEHWTRPDRRPIFFCQREAVETIIWLTEAAVADRQGIEIPLDEPRDAESIKKGYKALPRCCTKMATGSGKTTVMAMVAAWSILNKATNRQDDRFSDAVLVVGPNLTVKERLRVLNPRAGGNYYELFDLVPTGYRDALASGKVFVTNWHAFLVRDESDPKRRSVVRRGRESDAAFVKRVIGRDLGNAKNLLVLNDEAHHAYRPANLKEGTQIEFTEFSSEEREQAMREAEEATVWVGGLDRIHAVRGIRRVVDLSATPFYLKGTGYEEGTPLPWIVSDFGLVDAIECGITKVPRIPVGDDSGRPDPKYFHLWRHIMDKLPTSERETNRKRAKPESVWREAQGALATLAEKWKTSQKWFEDSQFPVPPALIVVGANTQLSSLIAEDLKAGRVLNEFSGESTLQIDSAALEKAEAAQEGESKDRAQELLRLTTATVGKDRWPDDKPPEGFEDLPAPPGRDVRCVVSVGMLTEGWDAQNVTQILGLRAFSSQLLCEQVVGRGLRRMNYNVDPATGMLEPEYCDVFGVPFEVIPVQGTTARPALPPPPSTLVQALASRKELEITFPRVEGYVLDVKQRVRCNLEKVPSLTIGPQLEPTEVVIKTQTGWVEKAGRATSIGAPETVTREEFYVQHRLQRTTFEIAKEITDKLALKRQDLSRLLFPQVLRIVEGYVEKRVRLSSPQSRKEEIALKKYRDPIVSQLLDAIEPDVEQGESALLPRIERHRPIGSTAQVQFRTTKKTKQTEKSHISHVVLDSNWEGGAQHHLEQCRRVKAYAKNDRLDFEILYEWEGATHKYIPDYLIRIVDEHEREANLILEIKGLETQQDKAKRAAADKWKRAVNNLPDRPYGTWDYVVCKNPNQLRTTLDEYKPA